MQQAAIQRCVEMLTGARRDLQPLAELPADIRPADLAEGYVVQDVLLAVQNAKACGYKIAATSAVAQTLLGVDGPFFGRLLEEAYHDSPAHLPADRFLFRLIEPEFAFILAEDLPPRGADYSSDEVSQAVASLHPAFEIVSSSFGRDWTKRGAPSLAADNAVHGAFVLGLGTEDWRHLDLANLEVRLTVDGEAFSSGRGEAVLGHPLRALTWLANDLTRRGRGLQAGETVTTGLVTAKFALLEAGQGCRADFGPLGEVTLAFE
ncbi:fumarylacetoacetate hydrolase family protein [Limibacillus sp. MBR-115]|jgi:2-keto-4-pentenoate hydratase|uniref:2-keto-4-pentenoate hydratase n=1 Tax=Limibacillus sp. MBR-115 TaxID=3156465 RepID=UPI00339AE8D0